MSYMPDREEWQGMCEELERLERELAEARRELAEAQEALAKAHEGWSMATAGSETRRVQVERELAEARGLLHEADLFYFIKNAGPFRDRVRAFLAGRVVGPWPEMVPEMMRAQEEVNAEVARRAGRPAPSAIHRCNCEERNGPEWKGYHRSDCEVSGPTRADPRPAPRTEDCHCEGKPGDPHRDLEKYPDPRPAPADDCVCISYHHDGDCPRRADPRPEVEEK